MTDWLYILGILAFSRLISTFVILPYTRENSNLRNE